MLLAKAWRKIIPPFDFQQTPVPVYCSHQGMGGISMDFYKAVEARRTVRDFENRPVPRDALERIVGAGLNRAYA